jgi:hypothetical protein
MYICGKLYCTVHCILHTVQLTVNQKYNKYHLPHIHILPPDDGLLIRPKHVEVR